MKYYHATDTKNEESIMLEGIKPNNLEGVVYLATTQEDALKFLVLRPIENISVFEVELPESGVEESFDHSQSFFKCKAYYYPGLIEPYRILEVYAYRRNHE